MREEKEKLEESVGQLKQLLKKHQRDKEKAEEQLDQRVAEMRQELQTGEVTNLQAQVLLAHTT